MSCGKVQQRKPDGIGVISFLHGLVYQGDEAVFEMLLKVDVGVGGHEKTKRQAAGE